LNDDKDEISLQSNSDIGKREAIQKHLNAGRVISMAHGNPTGIS
jgi:hypothetical protein